MGIRLMMQLFLSLTLVFAANARAGTDDTQSQKKSKHALKATGKTQHKTKASGKKKVAHGASTGSHAGVVKSQKAKPVPVAAKSVQTTKIAQASTHHVRAVSKTEPNAWQAATVQHTTSSSWSKASISWLMNSIFTLIGGIVGMFGAFVWHRRQRAQKA